MLMLETNINGHHFISPLLEVNHSLNGEVFHFNWRISLLSGHENMVRVLIDLGAMVNAEDENKKTPRQIASGRCNITISNEI